MFTYTAMIFTFQFYYSKQSSKIRSNSKHYSVFILSRAWNAERFGSARYVKVLISNVFVNKKARAGSFVTSDIGNKPTSRCWSLPGIYKF